MVPQEQIQHLTQTLGNFHITGQSREQIIQKLSQYYLLYQTCSDRVRPLGPMQMKALYDDAYKKWQSDPTNPLFEPPRNDEDKKAQYFAKCDEICGMEVKTMEDYITISFACWAGIQGITCVALDAECIVANAKISKAAHDLAIEEYKTRNPGDILPLHTSVYELGPQVINKTIRYRDKETGKIMELTVQDYGTSRVKGEWFEVAYDDLRVLQITARELREILTTRVDES